MSATEEFVFRRPFMIYSALVCGAAFLLASLVAAGTAWAMAVVRSPLLLLAFAGWLAGTVLLALYLHVRRPLTLAKDAFVVPGILQTLKLPLSRIVTVHWSIRFRTPTLRVSTSRAEAKISLPEFEKADQLRLIRYLRNHLPARVHRDWYRFCRYAVYVRREAMIDARDDRTPAQRRWEAICKWVGVTTGAVMLGMFSKEAGQNYLMREMSDEISGGAIPHEAFSDSEWNERLLEAGSWMSVMGAIIALCSIPFAPVWWRASVGAVAALLVALSVIAFRKQRQIEEEIAVETATDVMRRWDIVEGRVTRAPRRGKRKVQHITAPAMLASQALARANAAAPLNRTGRLR